VATFLTLDDLLARTVTTPAGCREWQGTLRSDGYGYVWSHRRNWATHRLAHYLATGEEPKVVRHTCDNPRCIAPSHLLGGVQADNMADMAERSRSTLGERHPQAKISEADVREIRRLAATREHTMAEIGRRFGIAGTTASRIVTGELWPSVKGGEIPDLFAYTRRRLTPEQVREIRASSETAVALAAQYRVSDSCIRDVKHRRKYRDVA
jgi:hypothetical protein